MLRKTHRFAFKSSVDSVQPVFLSCRLYIRDVKGTAVHGVSLRFRSTHLVHYPRVVTQVCMECRLMYIKDLTTRMPSLT